MKTKKNRPVKLQNNSKSTHTGSAFGRKLEDGYFLISSFFIPETQWVLFNTENQEMEVCTHCLFYEDNSVWHYGQVMVLGVQAEVGR